MMKSEELKRPKLVRELSVDELQQEEKDLTEHIYKLRFQMVTGQLENGHVIQAARKGLARVKTILLEKQRSTVAQGSAK